MDHIKLYLTLLVIITVVSVLFRKSTVPTTLILVIVGMLLSYVPGIPHIEINPVIILDGFLPLLLYTATYSASWREIKNNGRAISLMSIGHVLFITTLVAVALYYLIPQFGWPMAFILGAVISPPDDVAILSIGEKVRMPARVMTVLRGEALLNDATALTIFKFALVALITHTFHPVQSVLAFIAIICGEALYGIAVGYVIGEIRLRVNEPILQIMISLLTPFIAYIPADHIAGSGVISTVVAGIFITQYYWGKFPPDVRLTARSVWSTLEFGLQCALFLLVGLNLHEALDAISSIPISKLVLYSASIIFIIITGRFIWVYLITYLPRFLSPSLRKRDPYPPWQYPFLISWAGMRGGISLAAALAVPVLSIVGGINPRDLLVFLVFTSIAGTLFIQGLSLPWIIKVIGVHKHSNREKSEEEQLELTAKKRMCEAVLKWLNEYEQQIKDNTQLSDEIRLQIKVYESLKHHLARHIENNGNNNTHVTVKPDDEKIILGSIIAIERQQLELCWHENKISYAVKVKLEKQLDLRSKHIEELA